MAIQTRTTALQNEIVRLYMTFSNDGILRNPDMQPIVEILDSDGVTVLGTVIAQMENQGVWYADWYVPANLPLGNYYDRWVYQWTAQDSVKEQTMIFTVQELKSYINFLSKGKSTSISNRANQLLIDLANDFIYESMHIPIYFEQGMRIRQDDQEKRVKKYYYIEVENNGYFVKEGDRYLNNGQIFTAFKDAKTPLISSSESSMSSIESSSSSSSSLEESSSSDSSDILTSSSSSDDINYSETSIFTFVGTGDPLVEGELSKISGEGSDTINFRSYTKKKSSFSTVYGFAYQNWLHDPRPICRINNQIRDDGWHADYMGNIYIDSLMSNEDSVSCAYTFSYFSQEELLSFLNLGLTMMNSIPPASESYNSLSMAPKIWDAGILLYAAITALKRLIFGLNWQEKKVIYGRPEDAQNAASLFQDLYKSYQETWTEFGKNVKTRKLPGIALGVTPEYTLPGGRSRWFRYLFKQG